MSIYPRERISEALQDSANRGVGMLIAPAGFGKSEAASDAFGTSAHWVDIPEDGATVETLARLVIEKVSPRSLRALSAYLSRPETADNRLHLAEWCSSRLRTVEAPIVLEDFQRVCGDEATLRFIRHVIEATVPTVRWVIISRETPELPIGTWLARDTMTLPITAEDLSFEVSEGAGVAQALGVSVDDASLNALVADVAGWPLALRLSLGAWERTRALPPLRIRTRVVLFEFIEKEVWSNLRADDQHFFEAAAYLNELRPRILGAAGFADVRLTLERLHRRLPLLSRLGNGIFKLHELFREFILERSKDDVERRHQIASALAHALERFGDVDGAIAMYMRCDAFTEAIALLARHGVDRIENGHRGEMLAALSRFPREFRDDPVVTGLRGFALTSDGAYAVAKREIDQALKGDLNHQLRGAFSMQSALISISAQQPQDAIPILKSLMVDERIDPNLRLRAAAALASASALAGEAQVARDAIGFCSGILEIGSVELRATVNHLVGFAYLCLGEYSVAEEYATESVQLAQTIGLDSIAARATAVLQSAASGIYPDTLLARKYAQSCARLASSAGDKSMHIFGLQAQLMVASYQGDDDLYDSTDRELIDLGAERSMRAQMWLRFVKIVREVGRGNVPLAINALRTVDLGTLTAAERVFCDSLLGLLLASKDRDEAAALLNRPILIEAAKDHESLRFLAYAQVYRALGQWLQGRGRAARRAPSPDLSRVTPRDAALLTVIITICSTSRQTTTVRQLAQLTEPLVALQLDGHARFLRQILAPATITQLTRTELEVLRALRGGGTTSDVADRLGKSSHTVLSHLKSACSKIGCSGRAAAVAYALDMGWID